MRTATTLMFALLVSAGCGSNKGTSAGDKACQDLQAKLDECHLQVKGSVCNATEPCSVECAAHADCSQLGATPTGSYLACIATCSGASATDFVCKDASGFVHQGAVCDGTPQCLDGSDEANCGGNGTGGASNGTGGASGGASGGIGGTSGGANSDAGSAPAPSPECQAFVAHEITACPTLSRDTELLACAESTKEYAPEGCGTAWNAFIGCAANAAFSCTDGPSGCDTQMSGYFSCASKFVQKTGCDRLGTDERCTDPTKPYLFGCLGGTAPSNCVLLPPTGGAPEACCSEFAPP